MTPQEVRALALYTQLSSLSPGDREVDARITIRLSNGKFMGDVLLSARDLEALTDAIASLNEYARAERDDTTLSALAAVPELNPVALAQLQELDVTDLGDTDGGAA